MQQYLAHEYDGGAFELFGTGHLVYLAILASLIAFLTWGWKNPGEDSKQRVRISIVAIMLINEVAWHTWNIAHGAWSMQVNIPLHLCGLSIWATIYMLSTRDYRLYEFFYFVGLAGATQAIITPSAGEYGLPHFRAFQTLISHGMLVIGLVFIAVAEDRRPTWASIWKTMLALNIYMFILFAINYRLGSNYKFIMRKPDTASLVDLMGPWPWYLVVAEFLAVGVFVLLYLPFALSDRRARARIDTKP